MVENKINFVTLDDGFNYVDTFNMNWYHTHQLDRSGPLYCENCREFGSIREEDGVNIFLGYCRNCANKYLFTRGSGFAGFNNATFVSIYYYPQYLKEKKYRIIFLSMDQFEKEYNDQICGNLLMRLLTGTDDYDHGERGVYEHKRGSIAYTVENALKEATDFITENGKSCQYHQHHRVCNCIY